MRSNHFRRWLESNPGDAVRASPHPTTLAKSPEQSGLRRTFTTWLKEVFLPGRMPKVKFDEIQDLQEVHSMLAERVKEWTKSWEQQGEAGLLLRLLERRFGPVDEVIRIRVRSADSQTLLTWGERILTAQTIEEVFEV